MQTYYKGKIEFNDIQVNIGDGMKNDKFVAPLNGIYRFSFNANTNKAYDGNVEIEVRKEGTVQFFIKEQSYYYNNNVGFSWIMHMEKMNVMDLIISGYAISCEKTLPITLTVELCGECKNMPVDCEGFPYEGAIPT